VKEATKSTIEEVALRQESALESFVNDLDRGRGAARRESLEEEGS